MRTSVAADCPAQRIDIYQQKVETFGLNLFEINAMLSIIFSGAEVVVKAVARYRMQPDNIDDWHARNGRGEMVPFSAFATTSWQSAANRLVRMDGSTAIEISGSEGTNTSSGEVMDRMRALTAELPGGYSVA
ncbi:hypothetical protein P775_19300 [Puniceibacterium antarcticum]|uniref:Uncharacterized protein n=1 Tax=Puniceibacterium antarcticum TaxID=1206336 RepID=A0A2G8RAZ3_9RHOB|nr:hypothetical protein P775_19300 [Puniceibacterium antarcticum]